MERNRIDWPYLCWAEPRQVTNISFNLRCCKNENLELTYPIFVRSGSLKKFQQNLYFRVEQLGFVRRQDFGGLQQLKCIACDRDETTFPRSKDYVGKYVLLRFKLSRRLFQRLSLTCYVFLNEYSKRLRSTDINCRNRCLYGSPFLHVRHCFGLPSASLIIMLSKAIPLTNSQAFLKR